MSNPLWALRFGPESNLPNLGSGEFMETLAADNQRSAQLLCLSYSFSYSTYSPPRIFLGYS